jgi:LEA14-like dessication related protein
MGRVGNILLLIGGVAAVLYYMLYRAVMNLNISLADIKITSIQKEFVRLHLRLNFENNSNQDLTFNNIDLNLYVNNILTGKLINKESQTLKKGSKKINSFYVDVLTSSVGDALISVLKNGSTYPISIKIKGKANFGGLPVPVPELEVLNVSLKQLSSSNL